MASESGLAQLVQLAEDITSFKLYSTCLGVLWAYDYFLTVGDEIRYAWGMENIPMFALFLLIRYLPVLFLSWSIALAMSLYRSPEMCEKTGLLGVVYTTFMALFAQIVLTQRTYAITRKNKWVAATLYTFVAIQFGVGIRMSIYSALNPATIQTIIPLDTFRVCFANVPQFSIIAQPSLSVAFDAAIFVAVLVQGRLFKLMHPGVDVPNVLKTVSRDSAVYFGVISASHVLTVIMYLAARPSLRLIVTVGNTAFIPMMMARMIISLKEVARSRQPDPDLEVPSASWLTTNLQQGHSQSPHTVNGIQLTVLTSERV